MKAVLLLAALLAGCAHNDHKPEPFTPSLPLLERIDARLLEPCPKLPEEVVLKDDEDLLKQHGLEAGMYNACANRHNSLATEIEKLKLQKVPVQP